MSVAATSAPTRAGRILRAIIAADCGYCGTMLGACSHERDDVRNVILVCRSMLGAGCCRKNDAGYAIVGKQEYGMRILHGTLNSNTYSDAKNVIFALKQTFLSDKSCRLANKRFAVLLLDLVPDGLQKKKKHI
jgi:hypothetical protein